MVAPLARMWGLHRDHKVYSGGALPGWHLRQLCPSGPSEGLNYPLKQGCTPTRLSVVSLGKENIPPQGTPEL